jgi:hypothetical protein
MSRVQGNYTLRLSGEWHSEALRGQVVDDSVRRFRKIVDTDMVEQVKWEDLRPDGTIFTFED